jgi:enolase
MARIARITARTILDSRGDWTVEVSCALTGGITVRASVPHGKSAGSHEARSVPAIRAVRTIVRTIAPKLEGMDPSDQKEIDDTLIRLDGTTDKHRIGANAILGVSIACVKAAAAARGVPVWKHVRGLAGIHTRPRPGHPRLFMNIINGGLHAGNNLHVQEYMIIPQTPTIAAGVALGVELYRELGEHLAKHFGPGAKSLGDEGGYAPDFKNDIEPFAMISAVVRELGVTKKVRFGIDVAANGAGLSPKKWLAFYRAVVKKYPIMYIEDPYGEEEFDLFAGLTREMGDERLIAGDDLTTTNVRRMEMAHAAGSINAVIIKPNQIGTVSEALAAVAYARARGWAVVVSHRSGETNDDFIADFAFGVCADGLKLGAPARGERIAKYNRLLAIEAEGP